MQHPHSSPQEEAPLSPEALAIMAKARRRAGISVLIMLAGLLAIAGVIVYRLSGMADPAPAYALERVEVPAGAEVVSLTAAGGEITVSYRLGTVFGLRIYDGRSGEMIADIVASGSEAPRAP